MTKSVEEQMADIERRMKQLRARKQRIVARENAKARKRRTHLIIRLGGILSNEGVLGYDEGVWNDEGNRQRLLDMLKAHAAELRAWALSMSSSLGTESVSSLHRGGAPFYRIFCTLLDSPQALRQ